MTLGSPISPLVTSPATSSEDETRRVKFLCSFLGNILPRPQDGKLRYVGGETRIVCLARDIKYEQLMSKMRELYEEVTVLKYQQPDEDLDALVSIVNDDDVTNMMEEYDKLGSGDGFTKLRLFLFSSSDQDRSSHYVDVDEWDAKRRYMDGLNNAFDIWSLHQLESSHRTSVDDYSVEPTVSTLGTEVDGLYGRCSSEIAVPTGNLHKLTIPRVGSGPMQHCSAQRYGEKDGLWSPYLSPRLDRRHDPRHFHEFPNSPSSTRCCLPSREFLDELPEEYYRQQASHHPGYEHQPLVPESAVWVPATTVCANSKGGFPGNVLHGSGLCENCQLNFHKNQQYVDPPNSGNVFSSPFAECLPNMEKAMLTADSEFHQGSYLNETFGHEMGRATQHQLNHSWTFRNMTQVPSVGRPVDHCIIDGPATNFPHGHGNLVGGHHFSSGYVQLGDDAELPNDGFYVQSLAGGPPCHQIPSVDNHGLRATNHPDPRGADNLHPVSQAYLQPRQNFWRNAPNYVIDRAFVRAPVEAAGMPVGAENHSPRFNSSQKTFGYEATATFNSHGPDDVFPDPSDSTQVSSADFEVQSQTLDPFSAPARKMSDRVIGKTPYVTERVRPEDGQIVQDAQVNFQKTSDLEDAAILESSGRASYDAVIKPEENLASNPDESSKLPVDSLSYLPECIASAQKTTLEGTEMLKDGKNTDAINLDLVASGADLHNSEQVPPVDIEADADGDNTIEPTKAEAEAIARGLQTIKNDDLEEIRELGSGTYGAVYHGKWKGSDVAIKRIKASCFSGRPSERERLIADFWKEALILSSLHHPNVVSFYGIVRDGLGGSLATVTEYMVNGSLKQFLQKKDRTIDRRKRLIIAMDAAFGMEYLHEKKVVHFDLKCENLLVNMRDPQRPVCKIGDLGLSKVKQQTLVSGGVRGTLPWIAPELLSGKSNMVTEKIDVYSFGIVMWELLTGDEPYADMNYASIIGGILNNTLRPKVPQWCDPEWKALMAGCWVSDPAERPSFSEISQRLRNMAAAMNVK